MSVAVAITSWIWLALEIGLVVRDRLRGKGSSLRDQGTRWTVVGLTLLATIGATIAQVWARYETAIRLPGLAHVQWAPAAGLVIMCLGLIVRVWSITVLGRSFRTTVEVDDGQQVVDHGPYGVVRHPSYSGVLLITIGYGLAAGNWVSLALTVVLPAIALIRRITVEERLLVRTLGRPYEAYRDRTYRLVPGLW